MKQDKSYKLGIIGAGVISETRTIPAILSLNEFDILCAYDNDKERLENIYTKFSIPGVTSFEEFLLKKCDAVYIAAPNCYHVPYAIEALKNGIAVFVEKPCADTLKAAEMLLEAAEISDIPILVGYMAKWNKHNQKAKQLVMEKQIGELRSITASFGFFNTNLNGWRLFREKSGPGALGDLGIYAITTALDIFGVLPTSCTACAYPSGSAEYGDKFLSGRVNFSDGRWIQIDTSFLSPSCGYTIVGSDGVIHVEGSWFQSGEGEVILCKGNKVEVIKEEIVNPYEQEFRCFKNCLDGQPIPYFMGVESAVRDIRVMSSLDLSAAKNGEEVKI